MFLIQEVNSSKLYCTCQDVWRNFKIVDVNPTLSSIKIYMICHGGLTKTLLDISQFHHMPKFLALTDFEFEPREHVGISVFGGSITLVGQSYDGADEINTRRQLSAQCPFSNVNQK